MRKGKKGKVEKYFLGVLFQRKIPSDIEVALSYKPLALFILFTLITLIYRFMGFGAKVGMEWLDRRMETPGLLSLLEHLRC